LPWSGAVFEPPSLLLNLSSVPQRIFLHPGYNHKSLTEDYAILVVDTPFNFTPEVGRLVAPPIVAVNGWAESDQWSETGMWPQSPNISFYNCILVWRLFAKTIGCLQFQHSKNSLVSLHTSGVRKLILSYTVRVFQMLPP
jgi:hypothetical protein